MQLENTFPLKLQQSFPKFLLRSYLKNIIPSFIFSYPSQWCWEINKIGIGLQLGRLGWIYSFTQGFGEIFQRLRAQSGQYFMDISTGQGWVGWTHHNSWGFHTQISPKVRKGVTPKCGQFNSKDSAPNSCWEAGLYHLNNLSIFCVFRIKFHFQTGTWHSSPTTQILQILNNRNIKPSLNSLGFV